MTTPSSTLTIDGEEYPAFPTETTTIEMYSTPPLESRWIHYRYGGYDMHFVYRGKCQCDYCDCHLWSPVPEISESQDFSAILSRTGAAATREEMESRHMDLSWLEEGGPLPLISSDCVRNSTRRGAATRRSRDNARGQKVWPEQLFEGYKQRLEEKQAAERALLAPLLEPYPVVPLTGAYLWVNEGFMNFDGWTEEGRVAVKNSSETYPPEDVLVATSIVYGVPHDNAVILPGKGLSTGLVKIKRYAGYNAVVDGEGHHNKTVAVNALAVLVPPLNPATEKQKDRAERLDRELARLKEIMHRRMVAEGEARSWCGEFDPILDSSGLKPRKPKTVISGVLRFEFTAESQLDPSVIKSMQEGKSISSYIPFDKCALVEITQTDPLFTPALS